MVARDCDELKVVLEKMSCGANGDDIYEQKLAS